MRTGSGSSAKLRAQVADLLAAISVLGSAKLVLAAFGDHRVAFGETFRFEFLIQGLRVDEIGDGEEDAAEWEWRTSGVALVNALADAPDELEERVMLREEFGRRGLNEVIVVSPITYRLHRPRQTPHVLRLRL